MPIKKGIILGAGYGTRLRPLTNKLPKPLVPINGKPIIEYILENLAKYGVNEVYINASYLADKLKEYKTNTAIKLYIREEKEIRGTGGGILSFKEELKNDKFFVINGDILFDFDLDILARSLDNNTDAVLLLLDRPGNVLVKDLWLLDILSKKDRTGLQYSGIQIINGRQFFSNPYIVKYYTDLVKYSCIMHDIYKNAKIRVKTLIDNFMWFDVGTIDSYKKAEQFIQKTS